MENLGSLAILLALSVSLYAVVANVVGRLKSKPFLLVSGQRAIYAVFALVTLASGILVYSLMTGDFRFAYVASHSNKAMPTLYKFAAWWGGQEGSLLFWGWLLSTYAAVVAFTNRKRHRDFMPWTLGILGAVYLHEYGKQSKFARLVRFMAMVMTGVPSIVMGLFVYVAWTMKFVPMRKASAAGASG